MKSVFSLLVVLACLAVMCNAIAIEKLHKRINRQQEKQQETVEVSEMSSAKPKTSKKPSMSIPKGSGKLSEMLKMSAGESNAWPGWNPNEPYETIIPLWAGARIAKGVKLPPMPSFHPPGPPLGDLTGKNAYYPPPPPPPAVPPPPMPPPPVGDAYNPDSLSQFLPRRQGLVSPNFDSIISQ